MNRVSLILNAAHIAKLLDELHVSPTGKPENDLVAASKKLGEYLRDRCQLSINNGYIEYGELGQPNGWEEAARESTV